MKTYTEDGLDRAAKWLWLASRPLAALWFFGTVGYQVVYWLRFGFWKKIPLIAFFNYFDIEFSSVYDPQSWIGMAHIAQWILSLPLSLCGAVLIPLVAAMFQEGLRS